MVGIGVHIASHWHGYILAVAVISLWLIVSRGEY